MARTVSDRSPTSIFVQAALRALAREEAVGRRPRRLTEAGLATWQRFRGRMGPLDLVELLLEDAAVTQPFAFDARLILGAGAARIADLPIETVRAWLAAVSPDGTLTETDVYVTDQAERLGLRTRLARSDLHRGVRPHHRVLELPGTGGQLAHYLASNVAGLFLQDVFTIAWGDWRDRLMAGLVAVEHGLTGSAPIPPAAGIEALREQRTAFDYVVGALPRRGAQPYREATLHEAFPDAVVLLV